VEWGGCGGWGLWGRRSDRSSDVNKKLGVWGNSHAFLRKEEKMKGRGGNGKKRNFLLKGGRGK